MHKMSEKRILSLVLALCMVVSLVAPATAVTFADEEEHVHEFVDGKCTDCEAADPDYVAPACEHAYADGKCAKCEAADPNYVAPACEHAYADGKCAVCGETEPSAHTHTFVDGVCECSYACEHAAYEDGKCTVCGAEENVNSDGEACPELDAVEAELNKLPSPEAYMAFTEEDEEALDAANDILGEQFMVLNALIASDTLTEAQLARANALLSRIDTYKPAEMDEQEDATSKDYTTATDFCDEHPSTMAYTGEDKLNGVLVEAGHYGECGTNVYWVLDVEGKLTVDGRPGCVMQNDFAYELKQRVNADKIHEIYVGANVSKIGKYAFYELTKVTYAKLEDVTELLEGAFNHCHNLETVEGLENCTNIGKWALSDCYALTGVAFDTEDTVIGHEAFAYDKMIEELNLSKVKSLDTAAFAFCENLRSVKFPDGPDERITIGVGAFAGAGLEAFTVTDNMEIKSGNYTMTNPRDNYNFTDVTGTLFRNTKLTTITVKTTKESDPIGFARHMVAGCENLETIIFEGTPNGINFFAFSDPGTANGVTVRAYAGVGKPLSGKYATIYINDDKSVPKEQFELWNAQFKAKSQKPGVQFYMEDGSFLLAQPEAAYKEAYKETYYYSLQGAITAATDAGTGVVTLLTNVTVSNDLTGNATIDTGDFTLTVESAVSLGDVKIGKGTAVSASDIAKNIADGTSTKITGEDVYTYCVKPLTEPYDTANRVQTYQEDAYGSCAVTFRGAAIRLTDKNNVPVTATKENADLRHEYKITLPADAVLRGWTWYTNYYISGYSPIEHKYYCNGGNALGGAGYSGAMNGVMKKSGDSYYTNLVLNNMSKGWRKIPTLTKISSLLYSTEDGVYLIKCQNPTLCPVEQSRTVDFVADKACKDYDAGKLKLSETEIKYLRNLLAN